MHGAADVPFEPTLSNAARCTKVYYSAKGVANFAA